ncbi:MAG: RNA 2',3'-cyclic phosphodiesterase [Chloroherpetonaceae bacterium]|nr:RNA 2',3'-cyclic phosphodiesterase [Chloroherpetonaceae bacterium]MDW8438752.1 RNA 2',3'-cyclic phosphodiesterase [Chloroherpetonaceae bacterium]
MESKSLKSARLFVAAWADEPTRLAAMKAKARLEKRCRNEATAIKWVERENLHLTVRFLGDVALDALGSLREALERAAQTPSFDIDLRGLGAFPNRQRPEVIWVGVARGAEKLAHLAERLNAELVALGFEKDARPFHAHLTLGRARKSTLRALPDALLAETDAPISTLRIEAIHLVKSILAPSGPTYETMATARLTGA